jgi:FtsP/CotA-like multicopper oxidase with cupredoxin domain
MRRLAVPLTLLLLVAALPYRLADDLEPELPVVPVVKPNDNRQPAGRLRGNTLTLKLVVQMARWYPQARNGPYVDVEAFAEEGKEPMIPGPLIRVPTGTIIEATISNALDSAITIDGFYTRPAASSDSVRLGPGETRTFRFSAGAAGTYLYRGIAGRYRDRSGPAEPDTREREQLAGAFVIDSAGPKRSDRVLVINIWGDWKDSPHYRNALAINGKSWPYTERLGLTVGDTLRLRVVNASARPHPMHLHGFYYTIDAQGDIRRDTANSQEKRRVVVTEQIRQMRTIAMTWSPDRPGNWLFHCHTGFHVTPEARLDRPPSRHHVNYNHDPGDHMAGLVIGITVDPGRRWKPVPEPPARPLRIFVQEGPRRGRAPRSLGFVLQRDSMEPRPDSTETMSSALVLTRGEPTAITVVNRLAEPTGVHWHGIELESYSDGVAGWSGLGKRVAPVIAPRDSFVAQLTLPRAGTFIYHTHLNDLEQLTSGLYGAIVVLEPGKKFDPQTDHIYLAGWDGEQQPPNLVVNGDSVLPPLTMAHGTAHRLRLINIGVANGVRFSLRRDTVLASWKPIAKDGADLPAAQSMARRAIQAVVVGETFDFEFKPPEPGTYELLIESLAVPVGTKRRQRIDVH